MNDKVLRICEYNKIIDRLADHATSDPGRKLCHELLPMQKLSDIRAAQDETEDALSCLFRKGSINFGDNRDFTAEFRVLMIGASLSAPELLHLASFLDNVARVRAYGKSEGGSAELDGTGRAAALRAERSASASDSRNRETGDNNPGADNRSVTAPGMRGTVYDLFDCLVPLTKLASEIRRCILSEEEIADDASPELRRIRRAKLQTGERIHTQLQKMVNGSYAQYLQDSIITTRDDRYCLPVRAEYKSVIPGIVHDQSATGSTLFIEPAAVVELNNSLRELEVEEKKEIEKILADLSSQAHEHLMELKDDQANMTRLDFIFARASLALDMDATRPVFNEEHFIDLHKARHPLIDRKKVVPIDISFGGEDCDMVVITGPNTGGKTVTLKTVGLLELMGMAGLEIPAGDRSELSVFREVFADIGDEQSIEQNLSTFSAHMTNIVDILRRADKDCLCLIDELGAGTDPTEGAALAISILNFMHTRHIRTLATTHYSELKVYAMRTEGVRNASCEFDVDTLQPTYHLIMGIAGKSNAFAISAKLGLPNYIIETAKEQLSSETRNFEDLLTQLDTERARAEKEKQEAEALRADLDKREKELSQREKQLQERRQEILRRANEGARDILANAKREADEAISDLRKAAASGRAGGNVADTSDMEKIRSGLRDKVSKREQRLSYKPSAETAARGRVRADTLKLGDAVRILSMGLSGTVEKLPDKKGNVGVLCGIIHTEAKVSDLVWEDVPAGSAAKAGNASGAGRNGRGGNSGRSFGSGYGSRSSSQGGTFGSADLSEVSAAGRQHMLETAARSRNIEMDFSRVSSIQTECNLLGMTTDEAIQTLDKYLDDARIAHLHQVRVVHGKGTGALRKAVQEYLRKQKWIRSYRAGDFGEGDAGVTVVTLD